MHMTSQVFSGRHISMHRQRGAALIVGMIMLLLLTLIGVAGMRDTLLQEKMAGASRDRELALQAAEAALRAGEAAVEAGASMGASGGSAGAGLYNRSSDQMQRTVGGNAVTETVFWQKYGWDSTDSVEYSGSLFSAGVAAKPRYVIEQLPADYSALPDTSNAGETGKPEVNDYLITARGVGGTADAVVILQSRYRQVH